MPMDNFYDGNNCQEHAVEAFLAASRRMIEDGKPEQAERILRQALTLAEKEAGKVSALCGLVLVDLMRLLEAEGRSEEAEPLWERIREVMVEYIELHPDLLVSGRK
jgi:nucleotide-binding universal stress UspA family protein